ncbi:hypothetical protein [Caproicibacterium amylolyticum]|uniref:Helix-turn-helix domain-containing protein n=1 Tax=Caproicibacterium amylolyticum TaxID=2766537 RepID=A0A7G9WJV5_9FIRM|nr:hypothetical protein [Caproicibacterium amylolyticum]QNO18967.1 hypothetical protein H6X83_04910 [Caproicibacterium amylolyticum]
METFFIIHSWMIHKLHLSGLKLQVYAIIYGFSKDGCSRFSGSITYLQNCTGGSRQGVISALKALTDAGLLEKSERTASGVTLYDYKAIVNCESKLQSSGTEPEQKQKEPSVITLMLNDKSEFGVTQKQVDEWNQLYPAVDVMQELRNMKGWLDSNPAKRKTRKGIVRFANSWLSRKQDRGGSNNGGYSNSYRQKEEPKSTVGVGDYLP